MKSGVVHVFHVANGSNLLNQVFMGFMVRCNRLAHVWKLVRALELCVTPCVLSRLPIQKAILKLNRDLR